MEQQRHIDKDDARSGVTHHNVRYVLAASIALAIIILSAIWMTGAFVTPG